DRLRPGLRGAQLRHQRGRHRWVDPIRDAERRSNAQRLAHQRDLKVRKRSKTDARSALEIQADGSIASPNEHGKYKEQYAEAPRKGGCRPIVLITPQEQGRDGEDQQAEGAEKPSAHGNPRLYSDTVDAFRAILDFASVDCKLRANFGAHYAPVDLARTGRANAFAARPTNTDRAGALM